MMIGVKARAALYLFTYPLRLLYLLLALWDDNYPNIFGQPAEEE